MGLVDRLLVTVGGRSEIICWSIYPENGIFILLVVYVILLEPILRFMGSHRFSEDFRLVSVKVRRVSEIFYFISVVGSDGVIRLVLELFTNFSLIKIFSI